MELAIQFGNPFLFENVDEELDPLLDPVLEKSVIKEGNGLVIKLGMKVLSFFCYFLFLECRIVLYSIVFRTYVRTVFTGQILYFINLIAVLKFHPHLSMLAHITI